MGVGLFVDFCLDYPEVLFGETQHVLELNLLLLQYKISNQAQQSLNLSPTHFTIKTLITMRKMHKLL